MYLSVACHMSADLSSAQPLVGDASPENEQPALVSDSKLANDACESVVTVAVANLTFVCMMVQLVCIS